MAEEESTNEFRQELANLGALTTECERIFRDVLEALRNGKILPLCAQPLLQLHLEPVNNTSVIKMVEDRLTQMTKREIGVLVTGEFNAGKSTFVNIQMGGEYLPMDRGRVTHVACEIRHDCSTRLAVLKFEDKGEDECITLHEDSSDSAWQELRECIKTRKYNNKKDENNIEHTRTVDRIIINWPLNILEDIHDDRPLPQPDERNSGPSDFPKDFIDRLQRPHAESFKREEVDAPRDSHQTYVKEVRTSNDETTPKTTIDSNVDVSETKEDSIPRSKHKAIEHCTQENDGVKGQQIVSTSVEHASDIAPNSYDSTRRNFLSVPLKPEKRRDKEQEYASDADIDEDGDDLRFTQTDSRRSSERRDSLQSGDDQTYREILQQSQNEMPSDVPENINTAEDHTRSRERDFQFVLLDCPGIDLQEDETDSPEYTGMIRESKNCQSFIFIIDASKDSGVKKRGVKALMTDIEKEFKKRNMNFNPNLARFVANKTEVVLDDKEKSDDLKEEVLQKLIEIWPLVRKEHVIPFHAKFELEHHINDKERRKWIRELLLFTIRITLEEHCIWLLRMLEIAHTMAKLGQRASPVVDKLDENLRTTIEDAMNLREIVAEQSDKDLRRKARKELAELLKRNEKELKTIIWEENKIADKIPNANIDWSELINSIYALIGEKVEEKVMYATSELKKNHEQSLNNKYRHIDKELQTLQEAIFGLEEMKKEDAYLRKGLFTLLTPVFISASIRAVPLVNPLVLMVAPLIPLGLFGKSILEDIQETRNDAKRIKFKENKEEFMKMETKRVLDMAMNDFGEGEEKHSPLLKYFIGEPKNKVVNIQIDQVIHVAELLQEMSCNKNEECQKCAKRFVINMMKFYIEKVMQHEFTKIDDIIWIRNEEGNRCTIDQGTNACTYEATLSGSFDYDKCVAVKEFKCKLDTSDNSTSLPTKLDGYRECFYLRQLSAKRHDKLVNFLGTGTSITDGFLNLRIVMERYSGDLKRHVISAPRSPSDEKHKQEFFHYAKQCTEGLAFIHENNIIHRDVKPSNFLVKKEMEPSGHTAAFLSVVISDVGCAKSEKAICTNGQDLGTCVYWAPEISLANTFHSKASDVFSLGLVLWEIWNRQPSYNEDGRKTNLLKMVGTEIEPFIRHCLRTDPRLRITTVKLLAEISKATK